MPVIIEWIGDLLQSDDATIKPCAFREISDMQRNMVNLGALSRSCAFGKEQLSG